MEYIGSGSYLSNGKLELTGKNCNGLGRRPQLMCCANHYPRCPYFRTERASSRAIKGKRVYEGNKLAVLS